MLELLAPVKNYEYGIEAVKCGADALYIGASSFGARSAVTNDVHDIARLTEYAHLYNVKVYVTVNTLLYDDELESAEKIIWELYNAGVDALIVQDMAICRMNLPPIQLHASTQAAAITPERVKFLEKVGFERVVLERAMSLSDIKAIREVSSVDLEAFVFGAICVSYSGQCYLSHEVASRSGNRGVCAQPCRSMYDLTDEKGGLIMRNAHILSLKDLNLDMQLGEMIESGVMSFKIEGRLKDITYLKNSVSYYNSLLNKEISRLNKNGGAFYRSSEGRSTSEFVPEPKKTFSRGFTSYFVGNAEDKLANFESAKPIGELLAKVLRIYKGSVTIDRAVQAVAGDGLCFIKENGELCGAYVNRVENDKITLSSHENIGVGTLLYRNYDKSFSDKVERSKNRRVIDISVTVDFSEDKITNRAEDDYGINTVIEVQNGFETPKDITRVEESVKNSFAKSGDTIFNVKSVDVSGDIRFVPMKTLNEMRRSLLEKLTCVRAENYRVTARKTEISYPECEKHITYKANVTNRLSREFYTLCGAEQIDDGIELSGAGSSTELMRMKYCVRREMGECLKTGGKYRELYIVNNGRRFKLNFDCRSCEMYITKA